MANNNARNYGVVNALDPQQLLGQARGQGWELPAGIRATIREHEALGRPAGR